MDQHTIAVITNNDNLILDEARDVGHRVPNGCNLLIDCRHKTLRDRSRRWNNHAPWLTSLTTLLAPLSISPRSTCALAQEMGKLGMEGMFSPDVRFASSYDGNPGVVGSPGYMERN